MRIAKFIVLQLRPICTAINIKKEKLMLILVSACFLFAFAIVLHAKLNNVELLNWDNQSGLMVLFAIAMIPVAAQIFVQKDMFAIIASYGGSTRSASLVVQKWQNYFSRPTLLILVGGQLLFIGTINHFVNNPFNGFAGYYNLFGLLILNIVFASTCYVIYRGKKMSSIKPLGQRTMIKTKAMNVTTIIWAIAIYHLSINMWVSGLEIKELSLLIHSLYLQGMIVLSSSILLLPKPIDSTEPAQT